MNFNVNSRHAEQLLFSCLCSKVNVFIYLPDENSFVFRSVGWIIHIVKLNFLAALFWLPRSPIGLHLLFKEICSSKIVFFMNCLDVSFQHSIVKFYCEQCAEGLVIESLPLLISQVFIFLNTCKNCWLWSLLLSFDHR